MKARKIVLAILIAASMLKFSTASDREKIVKSWKDIRDYEIEKQKVDFSCGLASLATILNNVSREKITERDLINDLIRIKKLPAEESEKEEKYSFLDLKAIAEAKGYQAKGLALNFDNLKKVKAPAIVYIIPRGNNHFSVLKSIDEQFVYLADPSWGNMKIIHEKFLEMWKTRDDPIYYGQILIISKKPQNSVYE